MNAWQLVFHSPRRSPFPRDRHTVRRLVRVIVRVVGGALLAFHISDTHVHVLVLADRDRAGRLAQAVGLALAAATAGALPPAAITPIQNADHLRAAFEYVVCNDEKHGVVPDPWRENSNLPDLLGARRVASSTVGAVRDHLPRIAGAHLRKLAGWIDLPLVVATPELVREHVVDAAASVVARADLGSRQGDVRRVITAACQLARDAGIGGDETASLLGIGTTTAFRKRAAEPANALCVAALRLQLQVRVALPLLDALPFGDEPARTPWAERTRVLPR